MAIHARQYGFAFSLNKQSDILTAIDNANITKLRPIRNYSPIVERKTRISDKPWYGKSHPHATFASEILKYYELRSQERSATMLESLYALALVMGQVSSTQADSVVNPNEYSHNITFQNTATNKEAIYTTFGENFGDEEKLLYSGGWLNSCTFTGNREDHVTVAFDGGARKRATGTYTTPSITSSSFLHTLFGSVAFGAADSTADVSVDILSWNLTISQNVSMWNLMGNPTGEEDLVTRVYIGDQSYNGQVVFMLDKDYRDLFRNDTTCEFSIVCKSPDTIDNNQHSLTFSLHNFKISEEDLAEEDSMMTYVVNFTADTTLKTATDPYLTAAMVTDIDNSELLIAA